MDLFSYIPDHYKRIARFLVAGGCAAAVSATTLYFFNTRLGVWYIEASAIGFLAGFVVSFTLQKFWTFQDSTVHRVKGQLAAYLGISLFNLLLNTALVYCFVEFLGFLPVVAQLLSAGMIACESFFVYRMIFSWVEDLETI
jgi:putative flippase GtrA